MEWEKKRKKEKTIYIIKERKDCKKEKRAIGCVLLVLRKMKMALRTLHLKRNHVQNKQDFKSQNNKKFKISNEI
jgi:hypothetical protein